MHHRSVAGGDWLGCDLSRTRMAVVRMNDLVLTYKGKSVVLLTEAEIVNNTHDGLVQTGFLVERIAESMKEFGVFDDLYHPDKVE